jgi:hypothetical protein
MRVTLEFDDEQEAVLAMNGAKYLAMLQDIRDHVRSKLKYTDCSPEVVDHLEQVRALIDLES